MAGSEIERHASRGARGSEVAGRGEERETLERIAEFNAGYPMRFGFFVSFLRPIQNAVKALNGKDLSRD